MIYGDLTSY